MIDLTFENLKETPIKDIRNALKTTLFDFHGFTERYVDFLDDREIIDLASNTLFVKNIYEPCGIKP